MPKSFIEYNSDISEELLLTPLNHPMIIYKWGRIKLTINGKQHSIDIIGYPESIEEDKLIKQFDGTIGFRDTNGNIVSTIVFHDPLTINRKEYKEILTYLNNIGKDSSINLENIIELLKTKDDLNSEIEKFFVSGKYSSKILVKYKIALEDLNDFKSFMITILDDVINEKYEHLRPLKNLLKD